MGHDGAVGEDRLDAAQLRAHRPVAQHPHPARVGRHRPADGRALPAGDLDRQVQVGSGVGDTLQGDARAGRDLRRLPVNGRQAVQPGEAQHHLAVQRHPAADQPGVPALRHDGHPGGRAQGKHRRHFAGVPGPHDRRRAAAEPSGPVNGVPRGSVPGQHMLRAHDAAKRPEQRPGKRVHSPAPSSR